MNNTRGSITLGELYGKLTMLEIASSRCDRRGLLRLDRLITEHGAGMDSPVLGQSARRRQPPRPLCQHQRPLRLGRRTTAMRSPRRRRMFPPRQIGDYPTKHIHRRVPPRLSRG
jgi:hypothetical protein